LVPLAVPSKFVRFAHDIEPSGITVGIGADELIPSC